MTVDGNSPKPTQTGKPEVLAARVLRTWLDQVGGNQRIPLVLEILCEETAKQIEKGYPSPMFDADTLRRFYFDKYEGRVPDSPASKWLSSGEVRRWWEQRQGAFEQACWAAGVTLMPALALQSGGGRSNPTQYRFDFNPLPTTSEEALEVLSSAAPHQINVEEIRYQSEPANAAWWLMPIVGVAPFRMRSWRGYALAGLVMTEALVLFAVWVLIALMLQGSRPITASDVGLPLVATALSFTWWRLMRPIIRLPTDRVTVANDLFLAWSQLNGQLKLTRDARSKVAGGWFQLVRHYGTCPICSADVEITEGGRAFPGRIVGRCADSPLEHVFSFDPVSLSGSSLRHQTDPCRPRHKA